MESRDFNGILTGGKKPAVLLRGAILAVEELDVEVESHGGRDDPDNGFGLG